MALNGSGLFSRLFRWQDDAAANIDITASRMDDEFDGIATALSTALYKDGQQTLTANLPFGGFKATNVADGSARNQWASVGQVQDDGTSYATSGGSANAYTLTLSPAITAYAAGQRFAFKANHANDGASTLNVSALGAKAIQKRGAALVSGDIPLNSIVEVRYDGTQFQMVSPVTLSPTTTRGDLIRRGASADERLAVGTNGQVLMSDGTDPGWVDQTSLTGLPQLASANTFTAAQTIQSSDAGAGTGPSLTLDRASESPAANDLIGELAFTGRDSAAAQTTYARINGTIVDPTNGSEDGRLDFLTQNAGSFFNRAFIAGGLWMQTATGGDPGIGKINAADYQVNGKTIGEGAKFWAKFAPDGTISDSYNVASITDSGAGDWTVNIGTDFATANWACVATAFKTSGNGVIMNVDAQTAGTVGLLAENNSGAATDPVAVFVVGYGDQ